MLLTVKLDIEALFKVKVLNTPLFPWMLLTVIQDNSAQPPWSVLTVKSDIDAEALTSVLTYKLDTVRLGK